MGESTGWIDTHCHLDAAEFDADRAAVMGAMARCGVTAVVIPAVAVDNFAAVARCAAACPGGAYALGIHPLYTPQAQEGDLDVLRAAARAALADPRFVAIGEIGLDFFVPELCTDVARARQQWFYVEQLKLARELGLPVLLHVRRAQDAVLAGLRRHDVPGGIAHAFNGSGQQAEAFMGLGFKLGLGGAMTWPRALNIRRLASSLPEDALVLETDAPDIPPHWLAGAKPRNSPVELPAIGAELAGLRGWSAQDAARRTSHNAGLALPRLAHLLNL